MLDSIYHMANFFLGDRDFWRVTVKILSYIYICKIVSGVFT